MSSWRHEGKKQKRKKDNKREAKKVRVWHSLKKTQLNKLTALVSGGEVKQHSA